MSKLLIEEQPLQVLPSLAKEIGLNEAIFLQQLHYWLRSSKLEHEGSKWIYNTFEEWHAQFPFWGLRTIQRIVENLRELKLIRAEQIRKKEWDSRNYYTIEYDNLASLIRQLGATDNANVTLSDVGEVSPSVTPERREHIKVAETTTERTQETTTEKQAARAAPTTPREENFTVLSYLQYLAATPAFNHIDPQIEASKIEIWHARPPNQKRKITRKFLENWANRIERPLEVNGHAVTSENRNGDRARKPGLAERARATAQHFGLGRAKEGSG